MHTSAHAWQARPHLLSHTQESLSKESKISQFKLILILGVNSTADLLKSIAEEQRDAGAEPLWPMPDQVDVSSIEDKKLRGQSWISILMLI